jgi:hypothetical protein
MEPGKCRVDRKELDKTKFGFVRFKKIASTSFFFMVSPLPSSFLREKGTLTFRVQIL